MKGDLLQVSDTFWTSRKIKALVEEPLPAREYFSIETICSFILSKMEQSFYEHVIERKQDKIICAVNTITESGNRQYVRQLKSRIVNHIWERNRQ